MTRSLKRTSILLVTLPLALLLLSACFMLQTTPTTYAVALGDLDGDGDLDAFFANGQSDGIQPNAVWFNQGAGKFKDSGQSLGNSDTRHIALGDVDGDGDLDAYEGGWGLIYLNDGSGVFSIANPGSTPVEGSYTRHISLGDLDRDGDLDAFAAGCCGAFSGDQEESWIILPASLVELNDGSGRFSKTQPLSDRACPAGALGDLDSDGDLDAFLACWSVIEHSGVQYDDPALFSADVTMYAGPSTTQDAAPNQVFLNDGTGSLLDSGQSLGSASSFDVALGDLDGDADLDALVGNLDGVETWLNQGGIQAGAAGQFALNGASIPGKNVGQISLGDVDGDGDLDLLFTSASRGVVPELWLNDGRAGFTRHRQNLAIRGMQAYTLGDLDGDGDLDIFAGSFSDGYRVWINQGAGKFSR